MISASAMKRPFGEVAERMGAMNKMARQNVSDDVMAFMSGGGQAVTSGSAVTDFIRNNHLDDRAANDLLTASPEVQMSVMARGDLSGTRNPSSAVIGRIRDAVSGADGGIAAGKGNEQAQSLLAMLASSGGSGVQTPGNESFDQLMSAALSQSMDAAQSTVTIAYVAQHVPDQGYTLVAEDLANPGSNVYILHHQICNQAAVAKAKAVAFAPSVNEMGQLVATDPVWLLCGKLDHGKPVTWFPNVGSLGLPSASGDILVRCPEVKQTFGRAPYVFSKVVEVCGLQGGDEICFNVHVSPKGLPQVSAPMWRKHIEGEEAQAAARAAHIASGPPTGFIAGGKGNMTNLQMNAINQMKGKVGQLEGDVRDGPGIACNFDASQLSIAILKKMLPEKGFCLLTCDPTDETNEIYIHKSVASPETLCACTAVAFKPHANAKGQLQASAPVWLLKGSDQPDAAVTWCAYMGIIAELSTFGDGFVHCPEAKAEFGSEPFVFRKLMGACELKVGDQICFDVTLSASGKPQVPGPIWKRNTEEGKGGDKGFKGGSQWSKGGDNGKGDAGKGKGGTGKAMTKDNMESMLAMAKFMQGKGKQSGGEASWQGGQDSGYDEYDMAAELMASMSGMGNSVKGGKGGKGKDSGYDEYDMAAELMASMSGMGNSGKGGKGGKGKDSGYDEYDMAAELIASMGGMGKSGKGGKGNDSGYDEYHMAAELLASMGKGGKCGKGGKGNDSGYDEYDMAAELIASLGGMGKGGKGGKSYDSGYDEYDLAADLISSMGKGGKGGKGGKKGKGWGKGNGGYDELEMAAELLCALADDSGGWGGGW